MAKENERDLMERFVVEMQAIVESNRRVMLDMSPMEAWAVLAHLQLALRHPQTTGQTSGMARRIALSIQSELSIIPTLAIIAQRGWDQNLDELTNG